MFDYIITPQDFGAKADGEANDTKAIQSALDEAAESGKTCFFPRGIYRTEELTIPECVEVNAQPTWSYSRSGKTILIPADENQRCVFNISNSIGTTIHGIEIDGRNIGKNIHGIYMNRAEHTTKAEHSIRIDTCEIRNCTGNGIHAEGCWAVSVRKSQCIRNEGYGMYLDGCDAFIVDNWFSANGKAGFGGETWNSAVNFTSNRIEWNKECGVRLSGSMRFNLTGNYFDRSFGPALIIEAAPNYHRRLDKHHTVMPFAITVTGNNFVRSGKTAEDKSDMDCHIFMHRAAGITISANTFSVWKDDGRNGRISPYFGIVIDECADCVIANNVMLPGAVCELIHDKGGNGGNMIIKDNAGAVVPERSRNIQDPFTPIHFLSEGGAPWYCDELKGESSD